MIMDMKTLNSRKLRRGRGVRESLVEAGWSLLASRPVDGVTIDEIVEAAGVAKGSFYYHFNGRDEFAEFILTSARKDLEGAVQDVNDGVTCPVQRLTRGVMVSAMMVRQDNEMGALLRRAGDFTADIHHPLNKGLRQDIKIGQDLGEFKVPSRDAGVSVVMGTVYVMLLRIETGALGYRAFRRLCCDLIAVVLTALNFTRNDPVEFCELEFDRLSEHF